MEDREVSVPLGPALRCLPEPGYGVRWRGMEERHGRLQDPDFRTTQEACSQFLCMTSVATLVAARWNRRPTREGWAVQSRSRQ
jgi:hypothetical protein